MDVSNFEKRSTTELGTRVRAFRRITRGGVDYPGDTGAPLLSPEFVHAHPGDLGTVVGKSPMGLMVHWVRSGTVSDVSISEVLPGKVAVA